MHFKKWFFSRFLLVFYLAFWVKIFMLEIIKTVLFLSVYVFLDWLWLDHFIRTSFCTQNFTLHNQGNKKAKCWGIWCHSRERYLVSRSHLMEGNDGFSVRSTHETQRLLYLTLGHKLPYSIYITIWTILTVTQVLKKSGFHPKSCLRTHSEFLYVLTFLSTIFWYGKTVVLPNIYRLINLLLIFQKI